MSAWGREQRPGEWGQWTGLLNSSSAYAQFMNGNPEEPPGCSKLLSEDMERRLAIEMAFAKPFIHRLAEIMGRRAIEDVAKGCTDRRKKTCIYFSQIPPPIICGERSVASHKIPDALKTANTYMSMVSRMTKAGVVPPEVMFLCVDKQNVEPCLNIVLPVMNPIMKKLDEIMKRPQNSRIEMTPMIITPTQRQMQRGKQCDAVLNEWAEFGKQRWSILETRRILDALRSVPQGTDIVKYARKTEEEVDQTRKKLWHEHGEQQRICAENRRKRLAPREDAFRMVPPPPPPPPLPHYNHYTAPILNPPPVYAPYAAPSVSRMSGPSFDYMGPGAIPPPPPRPMMYSAPSHETPGPAYNSWRPGGGNSGTFPSRKRALLGNGPVDARLDWSSPSCNEPPSQYGREPPHFPVPLQEERNKVGDRTHRRIQMLVDLIKDRFPDPNCSIFDNVHFQQALLVNYSTLEQAEDLLISLQDLWTTCSTNRDTPAAAPGPSRDYPVEPAYSKKPSTIRVNNISFRRVSSDLVHLLTPGVNALYRSEDGSQMNTVKVVCMKNGKVVIDYEDNIDLVSSSDLYISGV